jgi:hypothetical protein
MYRLLVLFALFVMVEAKSQEHSSLFSKKFSPSLYTSLFSQPTINKEDSIVVKVVFRNIKNIGKRFKIIQKYVPAGVAIIKLSNSQLIELVNDSNIIFIDQQRHPKEELTTGAVDFSVNDTRYAQNQFPYINGDSILISIKEQRFDSADIDFKGRVYITGTEASGSTTHASIMATIAAGGGNSSSFAKGVAWGANVSSSDFASLLPDADSIYKRYKITVQNHSYGTGIENFYGGDALAYDMSVWNNQNLVHVFSAGNSGTSFSSTGIYASVQGFANITGSFKMAKNIITVGHVDSFNNVLALSSRGPSYDGRIKPELVAFGADGSSGAAAMVSGAAALLQQAYKQTENNYPFAQLIKAVLLNSADDVGAKGIDYSAGYGSLNVYRAVQTINEKHFFESAVSNGQLQAFSLTVPANAKTVKLTLAWMDTAAPANASKALINDLDLSLRSAITNETWLPWVLSSTPNRDSLLLPPVRTIDTLNNTEQITVDLPEEGEYIIEVNGRKVITGSQPFALAYQIDTTNHFLWNYPSSADVLTASADNVLRWESNINDNATIEYSTDGTTWQTLTSTTAINKNYYKWNVPDMFSTVQLRLKPSTGSLQFLSDTFVISKPLDIKVGFNCLDSFLLFWNQLPSDRYRLYQLESKYLESAMEVADTGIILKKDLHSSLFYSVASLKNNREGLRSFTVNYTTQGVGCYLRSFLASIQNNSVALTAQLGTTYNIASVIFQKINSADTQTIKTFNEPGFTTFTYNDLNLSRGVNKYRVVIKQKDGTNLYSSIETVNYFPDLPVIIYPNPAFQNKPINIIVQEPFVYSIQVYDVMGRLVRFQKLEDINNEIPPLLLSRGMYFIKIITENGKLVTQKLLVQ